jgi:oligopeptide transport system substrate-binding protein
MRAYVQILSLLLIGCLYLTSCKQHNNSKRQGEKYGGTLKININDVPSVIFPGQVKKRSEQIVVYQIYDGLLKYDPKTLELGSGIAKHLEITNNGTKYSFTINPNARFHDDPCFEKGRGRKIVAADFKYSMEQICRFKLIAGHSISRQVKNIKGAESFINSGYLDNSKRIEGISAIGDSIICIELEQPDALFIHYLAGTNALVFPHEAFEAYGFKSTVGSGPFTFSYPQQKGMPIRLVYNPNYYLTSHQGQTLPFLDTVVISFIVSTQKELGMLHSGTIDAVFGLTNEYVIPFLDSHIKQFQSNPPEFVMLQTNDISNTPRFSLLKSNIQGLYLNSQDFFDFSEVYIKTPAPIHVEAEE